MPLAPCDRPLSLHPGTYVKDVAAFSLLFMFHDETPCFHNPRQGLSRRPPQGDSMAISIVTGDSIPLEASFRRLPCHLHLSDRRQAFRFDNLSFLDVSCGRLRFYFPDKDQQFTRFDLKLLPARTLWCPDVRLYVATFFQFPVSIPVSAITLFEGGIFVRFPGYLEMDLLAETNFMHQRILREQLALGLFDRQQASQPAGKREALPMRHVVPTPVSSQASHD